MKLLYLAAFAVGVLAVAIPNPENPKLLPMVKREPEPGAEAEQLMPQSSVLKREAQQNNHYPPGFKREAGADAESEAQQNNHYPPDFKRDANADAEPEAQQNNHYPPGFKRNADADAEPEAKRNNHYPPGFKREADANAEPKA